MKTLSQVCEQHSRIFRKLMNRGTRLAAQADPDTGGNDMLCHNWGNDASREVWADTWRWVNISSAAQRRMLDILRKTGNYR